jgi:hypothetical protein
MTISAAAQRRPIFLFRSSTISVAFAATIATYVLYGPALALWVNLVSAVVHSFTPKPKPMRKIFFNVGSFTLAAFVAARVYALLAPIPPGDPTQSLAAVVLSSVLYFAIGTALTAMVIALTTNERFVRVWRDNYLWMPVNYVATAVNGAALALAYQALGLLGTLVFVLPLVAAWYSFRLYMLRAADVHGRIADLSEANRLLRATNERLERAQVSGIAALVGELGEAKLPDLDAIAATYPAVAVARDLGLPDEELTAIHLGMLLHDIGKIGIADDVLAKREPLTSDEWAQIRTHPILGAELLAHVPSMRRVRPIVLAHHERYDGRGYPAGLAGERIPIGARVIAVADTYDALTSARPYRRAMSPDDAIRELRAVAGAQLDPQIVDRFIEHIERRAAHEAPQRGLARPLDVARATTE